MKSHALAIALVFGLLLSGAARAAVDCTQREPDLPHVCASGPLEGQACQPDLSNVEDPLICSVSRPALNNSCQGAKCTLNLAKDVKFSGTMTIIVDENVSQLNDGFSQNNVAATLVLDLGKGRILSQTYQDLGDSTFVPTDSFGVSLTKQTLRNQADPHFNDPGGKPAAVNDLLFRPQDDEMAAALRALLGATGTPVVTKVSRVLLSDRTDGLATVLTVKIKGGFVQP